MNVNNRILCMIVNILKDKSDKIMSQYFDPEGK